MTQSDRYLEVLNKLREMGVREKFAQAVAPVIAGDKKSWLVLNSDTPKDSNG